MVEIEMPIKDFSFLRKEFSNIDKYLVHLTYSEEEVSFEIPEDKYNDFIIDYRSTLIRKGTNGKESFNETGVRLNNIFNEYIVYGK